MAIKLKYINSLFFTDNYTVNLGFKEKLIYIYLILNQEIGGIIKINIGELTENLNSKEMLDNTDDLGDYDEASIISRKDIIKALKKLIEDEKLIKMTDGYYLLTRSFKNQNIQNCYHMTGVINQLSKKLEGFPWMLEYMKSSSDYFGQMLTLVIEQLEKPKSKTSTQEKSDSYKVSLKSKFIEFCELNKIDLIKLLSSHSIEQQELWHTYQIPIRHVSDSYRHNSNSNNNINHNYNPNPKDKDYKDDNIKKVKKNKSQTNIESNKILSLGGQNFIDSQDGSQEPSREGLSERANAVISSRVISDYFRKAFKKFEMDVDPVVGSNIIEIEVKSYKTHKELETDARELVEYLVSSETIKDVTTVQEFPKMLKWYRSKIAPKLRDKLKDDKLYQSEEKVAQN